MKILLLITGLGIGGAEKQVCDLADKFAQLGYQVKLISLSKAFSEQTLPKNNQIEISYLNMTKDPLSLVRAYFQLRNEIKTFKPDVIHSHMFHANLVARLLRLSTKIDRLICTAHNTNEGGILRMNLYRFTNFLSDLNTNVSQDAVNAFIAKKAVKKEQMIAMENGIDTSFFIKDKETANNIRSSLKLSEKYVFLAVGRLATQKDYPNLLKAFSIVNKQKPNTCLLIAGIGELEQELKQYTVQLGISEKVSFLGLRRDINQLMNIADTYVMSSHFEGLPLVIGEAMATENVIVATDCGGTREVIGDNGFLVPIRNSEALANAMLQSMDLTEEERLILGKKSREHILKYYSLDAVANKWLVLYQKKK